MTLFCKIIPFSVAKYCFFYRSVLFYRKKFETKEIDPMAKIAPSILSADFANLERDIHNIEQNGSDYNMRSGACVWIWN